MSSCCSPPPAAASCPPARCLRSLATRSRSFASCSSICSFVSGAAGVASSGPSSMFRSELPQDTGMLFHFGKETKLAMWMKNTFIPLDMLFINKHGIIHRVVENTTPLSLQIIPGGAPTMVVVELNAGVTRRLGINAGDKVVHDIFNSEYTHLVFVSNRVE